MRIHIDGARMAFLRSLGAEGRPLWEAIESLKHDQAPADSVELSKRPRRREMHVRAGQRGFWLQWEVRQDRGETEIRVILIEEN
jgi:hypothetical protein